LDTGLSKTEQFLATLEAAFSGGTLVALSLKAYAGGDDTLRSIDIKPVLIKGQKQLSFTYHHKTRDIVKNHPGPEARQMVSAMLASDFRLAQLFASDADWVLDLNGKQPRLKQGAPSKAGLVSLSHDREKPRVIAAAGNRWLHELGITDAKGAVLASAQDKYRQINRYVEILGPLLKAIPADRLTRVLDMGAGKGYLTFAVADYLANTLGSNASVVGVEFRPDLVSLCNDVAGKAGLKHLSFAEGSIADFDSAGASVLIALHACDTATDDAIAQGIAAGADLIVVAPCCHKQIRREIDAARASTPLDYLMRHGIFTERQAEMVTDAIRALVLEYFGYSTKVFEFISDQHTPKNVLIVGQRSGTGRNEKVLRQIAEAKAFFGIRRHHLEDATGITAG
jgi:SAM-dependent methyltransferase